MSPRHHYSTEIPQEIFDEDLYDDGHDGIPMRTLTTRPDLRTRFLCRLAKITETRLTMEEVGETSTIYMSRSSRSPQAKIEEDVELQLFLQDMKGLLEIIAQHRTESVPEQAKYRLKDLILRFAYSNIDHIIQGIKRTFAKNQNTYDDFVTRMFGIEEGPGSKLDRELGALVIQLHQTVSHYDASMKQLNGLIDLSWSIPNKIDHLNDRLKYLLQTGKFGTKLYHLISTLGSPRRAYNTFVRTAQTSESFQKVIINAAPKVNFAPKASLIAAAPLQTAPKQTSRERQTTTKPSTPPPPPQKPMKASHPTSPSPQPQPDQEKLVKNPLPTAPSLGPQNNLIETILPYLCPDDRKIGLIRLQPASKQDTARLLAAVLHGNLLPSQTNAWYEFGFVAMRTEEEERYLAGLYASILKEASDKQSIFRELTHAMETNTLTKLFDNKSYPNFRNLSPRIESFLNTPPKQRSTVWRLKHFVHDADNTEPPAVLQRDYGFKYCRQRDEVTRIKLIYANMLASIDAKHIHHACQHGRLAELAAQRGIHVDAKDRRLLQNDYPAPYIALDNGVGLQMYARPFYRRRL
ncbi:hypothetical protein BDU57DRAFT_594100, partial [Ampelomyces quisqualis]